MKKYAFHLRMKEGSTIEDHLNEFNSLVNKMLSIGVKVEDEDIVIFLLCSRSDT